ncbi:MAG: protein-L-isoaspartate(D-aspartate) O-methyltransferase, partial [Chloroflexota bacterium]|nr:protein-L-isoaspartate(D-aspartate) O-methyltransferase [Chloroflexota bacterium]
MNLRKQEDQYTAKRETMVREQIERRGIHTPSVLEALRAVPRHLFLPESSRRRAYSDGAMRIGHGQTISQPYIVALMTDLLKLQADEIVLEVGTGSGYQAAILSHLAAEVHTIERHPSLSDAAKLTIESLGIDNVHFYVGDGTLGLAEHAPYDAIIVTAAAPKVPRPLLDQLDEGGRMVL